MIMKLYTIYDRKAEAHLTPFNARSDGEARRMIMETMISGQTKFVQFPGDYVLYGLGQFDDQTGVIVGCDRPEKISELTEILDAVNRMAQAQENLDEAGFMQADIEDAINEAAE